MKICLVVEGSYPYVTGGLSAWVQMLIKGMPQHQFIIYSIAAEEKDRGHFRYKLPENIIDVREIFLDSILNLKNPKIGNFNLKPEEMENLSSLICGEEEFCLEHLLQVFRTGRSKNALDIFMSFEFFDVIKEAYKRRFSMLPFTDFFWTVRSMLLPLIYILQQDLPEADVYHSVATGYAGVVGSIAAEVYQKPFILTEHGIYSREREEEIIKSSWAKEEFKDLWITYFYSLSKLAYKKSCQVFSLFEKNAQMQAYLGCSPEKIKVIPNGINIAKYSGITEQTDESCITIGTIARIVPIKDIFTMLRSFALVKQQIPTARFYIIGPTDENREYYEECLQLVHSLELKDIEFTGAVDVKKYLGKLDILVLSSISEGQPLVLLEGLANRKPFVCTDVGSCREILYGNGDSFGEAGIIVSLMDSEGMANALVNLAKNRKLRMQMGENGYSRVTRYYTEQAFLDQYKEVYAGLE